jgi:hypothetical protein
VAALFLFFFVSTLFFLLPVFFAMSLQTSFIKERFIIPFSQTFSQD